MRVLGALALLLCLIAPASAQDASVGGDGTNYSFIVVECQVHRAEIPVSDKHPQEHRYYISQLSNVPTSITDYELPKRAAAWFDKNVQDTAKASGLILEYYDNNVKINGGAVYLMKTMKDVETCRNKALEDLKGQNANVFTFTWNSDGTPGDPDAKLLVHVKGQPLYPLKKK